MDEGPAMKGVEWAVGRKKLLLKSLRRQNLFFGAFEGGKLWNTKSGCFRPFVGRSAKELSNCLF